MARITATEKSQKSGFIKLTVVLENKTTVVKEIPASVVATENLAKVYLTQVERQSQSTPPAAITVPTDFSFLNGVSN